ncbi:MAG: FapA family protein [Planctomycetota bacterium]
MPELAVEISPDRMEAHIVCTPSGKPLDITQESVLGMLGNAGVCHGIDPAAVASAVAAFPGTEKMRVRVAVGTQLMHGTDGSARFVHEVGSHAGLVTQDGKVDAHRLQLARDVKAGELLAVWTPSTMGFDGKTVTGEALLAQPGDDCRLAAGGNVKESKDGREFRALIDGILFFEDGRLNVASSYEVKENVDYATGNIETRHAVNVRKSVRSTFSVHAGCAITVGEHVDGAVVESKESIVVHGGICHGAFGSVRARGNVEAKWVLNAQIQSRESIELGDSALHSFLVAEDSIQIIGGKGTVVGGRAVAGRMVEVKVAGSKQGVKTILQAGYDYRRIAPIEKKLRRVEKDMARILAVFGSRVMEENKGETPELEDESTSKALKRWRRLEEKRLFLWKQRDRILESSTGKPSGNPCVIIREMLHPGVRLLLGKADLKISSPEKGGRFVVDPSTGEIEKHPL